MANINALFDDGSDEEQQQAAPGYHEQAEDAAAENLFESDGEQQQQQGGGSQHAGPGGASGALGARYRHTSTEPEERRRRREVPLGPPLEMEAPLLPVPPPGSNMLLRTSHTFSLQPAPFDPATYEKEEGEEDLGVDETGRPRLRLANVNAVMRWRQRMMPDGRQVRESNARFVRWEDGSLQLLLGSEVLDVAQQDMSANNTFLFCLRTVMLGQGHLVTRLALRPASLHSGIHKRLREAIGKQHTRGVKVQAHGGLQDPEAEKARREAAIEESIRSREALARKQDRVMARAYGGGGRARPARLSERYLEEEQDWEDGGDGGVDDGLTAVQRARLSMARRAQDEDAEAEAGRRLQAAKRGPTGARRSRRSAYGDDDDDDGEELLELGDEEDDEEADYNGSGSSGGDEDDEDDDGGRARKSRKTDAAGPRKGAGGGSAAPKDTGAGNKAKARRGVVLSDDDDD